MGHQSRAPLLALWRARVRQLFRTLYPSFSLRRDAARPLSVLSMAFVLSLIATGVYLVVPVALVPQLRERPALTTVQLALFSWCVGCTLLSYMLTALAAPGRVPDSWKPREWVKAHSGSGADAERGGGGGGGGDGGGGIGGSSRMVPVAPDAVYAAGTSMVRADGGFRFCALCNVFKPDRAHHCSTCEQCVLLMDHHCPFTGNSCIGLLNRKFFVLFLYYATLSCTLVATLTPGAILRRVQALDERPSAPALITLVAQMMGYMLCALHALVLAPFALFHTYLVLNNRTTIEKQELTPAPHVHVLRRSDRGWLRNWKRTFGAWPLLWLLPVAPARVRDGQCCARADDAV